jgi:hypothetical protein
VDRSSTLVAMARVLAGAHVPQEQPLAMLAARDRSSGWEKFTHRSDAAEQYQQIARLVSDGAQDGRRW